MMPGKTPQALQDRVKELTCPSDVSYDISHDAHRDISLDQFCQRIFGHLVPAMQFPPLTAPLIETIKQALLLAGKGCALAQGYLFSRPLSVSDMSNYLAGKAITADSSK